MAETSGLNILSLDGGGVRGLSSLLILQDIMERVNTERKERNLMPVKPCEIFDLIGGTSTGGIIAVMLGRLRMDVSDCIQMYKHLFEKIFGKQGSPVSWKLKLKSRFDGEKLAEHVREIVESQPNLSRHAPMLDETPGSCRVAVCAVHESITSPVLIRSYKAKKPLGNINAAIWQAVRATSAATSFFDPVKIDDENFVDGALGANNPIVYLWNEAKDIWGHNEADFEEKVNCVLSIGTGHPHINSIQMGIKDLVKTLKSITVGTVETACTFAHSHSNLLESGRYCRLDVTSGLQGVGLEEYKKEGRIKGATRKYMDGESVSQVAQNCAKRLAKDRRNVPLPTQTRVTNSAPAVPQYLPTDNMRDINTHITGSLSYPGPNPVQQNYDTRSGQSRDFAGSNRAEYTGQLTERPEPQPIQHTYDSLRVEPINSSVSARSSPPTPAPSNPKSYDNPSNSGIIHPTLYPAMEGTRHFSPESSSSSPYSGLPATPRTSTPATAHSNSYGTPQITEIRRKSAPRTVASVVTSEKRTSSSAQNSTLVCSCCRTNLISHGNRQAHFRCDIASCTLRPAHILCLKCQGHNPTMGDRWRRWDALLSFRFSTSKCMCCAQSIILNNHAGVHMFSRKRLNCCSNCHTYQTVSWACVKGWDMQHVAIEIQRRLGLRKNAIMSITLPGATLNGSRQSSTTNQDTPMQQWDRGDNAMA